MNYVGASAYRVAASVRPARCKIGNCTEICPEVCGEMGSDICDHHRASLETIASRAMTLHMRSLEVCKLGGWRDPSDWMGLGRQLVGWLAMMLAGGVLVALVARA